MSRNIVLVTLAPKTHRTSEENLGLGYLKAVLVEANYNVKIIDGWLNELTVDEVYNQIMEVENPLFVGLSSYMSNTLPTINLINKLKQTNPQLTIVCGGFGPTFYPIEHLNNGADIVVRGEGEKVIVNLAKCLEAKSDLLNVKGIYYKDSQGKIIQTELEPLVDDLDILPFPSRDTLNVVLDKKSTVDILTARGCSGNCQFCSVIAFFRLNKGKVWRTRSIKNIVDEIESLYKQGVRHIKVVDDSFVDGIRDEQWCQEFADEINKRNIKVQLRGQIRADKITDKILYHLKRAGFFSFACGIENGSETALKRMNKKATIEDNKRALELFKKHDYIVQMGYILFDKDTTLQELEENYEFLKKHDFTVTKGIFSEMYSAEGTQLTNQLRSSNELIESDFINNNNKYIIVDETVRKVYDALKYWHKNHSEIYDKTIDPITAPKAIPLEEIRKFYEYALKLKNKDLEIFKLLLETINEDKNANLMAIIEEQINHNQKFYECIEEEVNRLYEQNELKYNASKNPFI